MRFRSETFAVALILIFSGACHGTRLLNTEEWKCVDSDRSSFRRPDSVQFLTNLGDRGEGTDPLGSYWIRYVATNASGRTFEGNMKCRKRAAGSYRSDSGEYMSVLSYNAHRAKTDSEFAGLLPEEQNKIAAQVVLFSTDQLPPLTYFEGEQPSADHKVE